MCNLQNMSYFHAFINVWTTFHRKLNPFLSWLKAEFVLLKNPAQQKWWLGMDTFHLLLESHFQLFSVTPFFSRKLTSMDHSNYLLLSLICSLSVTRESPDKQISNLPFYDYFYRSHWSDSRGHYKIPPFQCFLTSLSLLIVFSL